MVVSSFVQSVKSYVFDDVITPRVTSPSCLKLRDVQVTSLAQNVTQSSVLRQVRDCVTGPCSDVFRTTTNFVEVTSAADEKLPHSRNAIRKTATSSSVGIRVKFMVLLSNVMI